MSCPVPFAPALNHVLTRAPKPRSPNYGCLWLFTSAVPSRALLTPSVESHAAELQWREYRACIAELLALVIVHSSTPRRRHCPALSTHTHTTRAGSCFSRQARALDGGEGAQRFGCMADGQGPLPNREYGMVLGESLLGKRPAYEHCTIRYNFKPNSVASTGQGVFQLNHSDKRVSVRASSWHTRPPLTQL
jgi:hypothetical protein